MDQLAKPTKALARRIMSELSFENRLVAHRLRLRLGLQPQDLYSFAEALAFLFDEFPHIKTERLAKWIREALGDDDLADKIAALSELDLPDAKKLTQARNLMGTRYKQCKGLAG
jgi:hypothetical protein